MINLVRLIKEEKKIYYYTVYGLNIKSDIEINEFLVCENRYYDINFIIGNMPEEIIKLSKGGARSYYSKNKIWFHIDNIASYYVENGDTVIVEPCENADMTLIKIYLMCSCLGFIMIQRENLAIHGGTVALNSNGIIITGDRGAGKSTLTSALRLKGYKFISDDVAAIKINEIASINPGFPYQKLCEDAMESLGYDKLKYSSFSSDDKIKYMVPSHKDFINYSIPLKAIFELVAGDIGKVEIEEIIGGEKLSKIIKNIYRIEYIDRMGGITPKIFKQCIEIAKYIKFYKITRPRDGFTVNDQIELIEEVLNSNNEKVV